MNVGGCQQEEVEAAKAAVDLLGASIISVCTGTLLSFPSVQTFFSLWEWDGLSLVM